MTTNRREKLIKPFLSELDLSAPGMEVKPLYLDLMAYLSDLGYEPQNIRSNLVFKHDKHGKQMAKMGMKGSKTKSPFFALRFSACDGYSKRFSDIVGAYVEKYPTRTARCVDGGCEYCAGEAATHVYRHEGKIHCGAYVLEIPDVKAEDIPEIKKLIKEEHVYLMKHQAGVAVE